MGAVTSLAAWRAARAQGASRAAARKVANAIGEDYAAHAAREAEQADLLAAVVGWAALLFADPARGMRWGNTLAGPERPGDGGTLCE